MSKILRLSDNVYQLTTERVNLFYIKNEKEEVLIVDSGVPGAYDDILYGLKEIESDISKVKAFVGTHAHYDHVGTTKELLKNNKNIKIYLHEVDAKVVESNYEKMSVPVPAPTPEAEEFIKANQGQKRDPLESFEIDEYLNEDSVIEGFENIDIIEIFGHTYGQIGLLIHDNKNVFLAADSIRSQDGLQIMYIYADLKMGLETISKLSSLDIDVIGVGHGEPIFENVGLEIERVIQKSRKILKDL